jgi:peroxin-5
MFDRPHDAMALMNPGQMMLQPGMPAALGFQPPVSLPSSAAADSTAPRSGPTESDVDDELRRHAGAVAGLLQGSEASGALGEGGSESLRQLLRSIASGATGVSPDGLSLTGEVPAVPITALRPRGAAASSSAESSASASAQQEEAESNPSASGEYAFVAEAESNPFLGGPARALAGLGDADGVPETGLGAEDALSMGARLFREGRLREAVLCLEAAVRQEPDLSEAWRILGNCLAESEDDRRAILCLERAVESDPFNLRALLDLGCSLVNELQEQRASLMLTEWVRNNPRFAHIDVDEAAAGTESEDLYSDGSELDGVTRLMLRVSESAPEDVEVANVLGLLYNISRDWDAAVGAFEVASRGAEAAAPPLASDPKASDSETSDTPASDTSVAEYIVLNRLAATLANGGRAAEAIPVYSRVLELRPGYTRAMYNLGVSLDQAGRHREAVQWLVRALQRNEDAGHIWRRLRIALFSMDGEQRLVDAAGGAGESESGGADAADAAAAAASGSGSGGVDDGSGEDDAAWRDRLIGHAYDMDVDGLARELGLEAPAAV